MIYKQHIPAESYEDDQRDDNAFLQPMQSQIEDLKYGVITTCTRIYEQTNTFPKQTTEPDDHTKHQDELEPILVTLKRLLIVYNEYQDPI